MIILLFNNLDISFIENFIDSYLNKNEIEELGKSFTKNRFLSNFLEKIKNIWNNKLYDIEINYRFTLKKNPDFDLINYYYFIKNNNNQKLPITISINKKIYVSFQKNDLYPGFDYDLYGMHILNTSSCTVNMLFQIHKNINKNNYKKILEIFNYCNKYFLHDNLPRKIIFKYNSDYIIIFIKMFKISKKCLL
jgi:hypothetical protein